MELCKCCRSCIATRYTHDERRALVPLCNGCFMKIPVAQIRANAKAECEIETLNYWWALGEAQVNR